GRPESGTGGHLFVVPYFDLRAQSCFMNQFGVWDEVVVQRFPVIAVKGVDERTQVRVFKPVISEQLSHMTPVFLFHMSMVVLFVGSGPGEADRAWPLLKIAYQVPVEELAAIVAIEAQQIERQGGLDFTGGLNNAR